MMHCTATGKLFAALDGRLEAHVLAGKLPKMTPLTITDPQLLHKEYDSIRMAGFSRSDQEAMEGVVGYALPIRDGNGSAVAALQHLHFEHRRRLMHTFGAACQVAQGTE
jgi:DNA-binding IclR family transcriptional regulator